MNIDGQQLPMQICQEDRFCPEFDKVEMQSGEVLKQKQVSIDILACIGVKCEHEDVDNTLKLLENLLFSMYILSERIDFTKSINNNGLLNYKYWTKGHKAILNDLLPSSPISPIN